MTKLTANQINFLETKYNVVIDKLTLTYTKNNTGDLLLHKAVVWGPSKWFSIPKEWIKEVK